MASGFQVESDQTDKNLWTSTIEEQLLDTEVELKVNLGATEISLDELMQLKKGDIIPLDQDSTGEFDVYVENVKKYKAYHGVYHGTVAVQVTDKITK